MLLKPKKNLVTVLDIGSTKIAALLARIYEGNVSIIGFACKPSQGIKNGIIIDIRKAANAISATIEELENICGEAIESAYITITSCGLSSHNLNFEILTGSGEIGEREIKTVLDKGHESLKENDKLAALHCLPIEYMLDGTSGIVNPYGMYGTCLAVKLHIIAASKPLLINIASCLGRCHLSTSGYIATAYADGFACVSDDDKNLGTILVDIGGGTTSLGIYKDSNFIHIDSIPIGGINITKDIACAFSLSINVAEKLKITHGTLYPSSDYHEMIEYDDILVKEDDQVRIEELAPISKFDLNDVINARVDEILDMVNERLMKIKSNVQLFRKIILTGGTSKIDGMREKFIKKFNTTVSYGKQDKLRYSDYDITDPSLSAAVGSVLLINDFFHDHTTERQPLSAKTTGQKSTLVKWIQKHF